MGDRHEENKQPPLDKQTKQKHPFIEQCPNYLDVGNEVALEEKL